MPLQSSQPNSVRSSRENMCNKVKDLTELLKIAYCILYTDSKYLIEFDKQFLSKLYSLYGENAIVQKDGYITIYFENNKSLKLKYLDVNSIIGTGHSNIQVKDSAYVIL